MPQYLSPGVYVEQVPSGSAPIAGVGTSTAGFVGVFGNTIVYPNPDYDPLVVGSTATVSKTVPTPAGDVKLITNFTEFKQAFGDFSNDAAAPGHALLAHA